MLPGFPSRDEVRARYEEGSGRELSGIDYYVALGLWKLAIVLEGVFARYSAGQYGDEDDGGREFAKIVERLVEAADEAERRLDLRLPRLHLVAAELQTSRCTPDGRVFGTFRLWWWAGRRGPAARRRSRPRPPLPTC